MSIDNKAVVIKLNVSSYPNPIVFKEGDVLVVGRKDEEYQGWVRVTTSDRNEGWAPETYINIKDGHAIANQNYSAKELDVNIGDEIVIISSLNDWSWVSNENNEEGWIPDNCIGLGPAVKPRDDKESCRMTSN